MKAKDLLHISASVILYHLVYKRTPLTVSFLSTYSCNQKCSYCDWTKLEHTQMTTEQAKEMICSLKNAGTVKLGFAGGESLLREDIDELLECSRQNGLITSVSTNGREVPNHIEALKKNVDIVQVSLDGRKNTHDSLRGEGSYDAAIKAINILKRNNIKVITNTVITKKNIGELDYIINFAKENNIFTLFQPVFYYGISESKEIINKILPSYYEICGAMEYLITQKRITKVIGNSYSFFNYIRKNWNKESFINCYANNMFCTVDPMGYLIPCCFCGDRDSRLNITENGFVRAFENAKEGGHKKICKGCYCNAYMESNLLFSFNLSACTNALKIMA